MMFADNDVLVGARGADGEVECGCYVDDVDGDDDGWSYFLACRCCCFGGAFGARSDLESRTKLLLRAP